MYHAGNHAKVASFEPELPNCTLCTGIAREKLRFTNRGFQKRTCQAKTVRTKWSRHDSKVESTQCTKHCKMIRVKEVTPKKRPQQNTEEARLKIRAQGPSSLRSLDMTLRLEGPSWNYSFSLLLKGRVRPAQFAFAKTAERPKLIHSTDVARVQPLATSKPGVTLLLAREAPPFKLVVLCTFPQLFNPWFRPILPACCLACQGAWCRRDVRVPSE